MTSKRTTAPALAHPPAMPAVAPVNETGPTLTTVEIAERTGKRHADVMRDARRVFDALELDERRFASSYLDGSGRERPCFSIPRREVMVISAGYSIKLRAALVDRLDELERAVRAGPIIPTTFADALRLAAEQAETVERQAAVIESQRPAVAVVARITASSESLSVTEAAKLLRIGRMKLFAVMAERGFIYRKGGAGRWQAYQSALDGGWLEHDAFPIATASGPAESYTLKVTPRGIAKLAAMLTGVQLDLGIGGD